MAPGSKSQAATGSNSTGSRGALANRQKQPAKVEKDPMEVQPFSPENIQHNMKIVYYCKTFLSIIAGVLAGILGLTGIAGFLLYLVVMALSAVAIFLKSGGSIGTYFDTWQKVAIDGVTQGAMSFVLFWTLAYDIVHIF